MISFRSLTKTIHRSSLSESRCRSSIVSNVPIFSARTTVLKGCECEHRSRFISISSGGRFNPVGETIERLFTNPQVFVIWGKRNCAQPFSVKLLFQRTCIVKHHSYTAMGKKKNNKPRASSSNSGRKSLQPLLKIPSKINVVVIGTGGPGTSQSLLVTTEYNRYMFNCGEGTQRLAAMSKGLRSAAFAKLGGLENIFITHKSWENTGGLLGLAMTLEGQKNPDARLITDKKENEKSYDRRTPKITIHGPPGVEKIALMARKFSVSANLNIVKARGEFRDSGLTITPVPFYKIFQAAGTKSKDEEEGSPEPKKQKMDSSHEVSEETNVAYAYLCQPKPPLPKINVEKCVDAGVTIGPMVGQLQRGYSVTLQNGKIVHPDEVRDNVDTDKRPFLVLGCPTVDFLPSLTDNEQIQTLRTGSGDNSFALVVHMTPAKVYNSEEYQKWLNGFSSATDHLVLNRTATEADLIRVRAHQARLNTVSQEIFPLLPNIGVAIADSSPDKNSEHNGDDIAAVNDVIESNENSNQGDMQKTKKLGRIMTACSGLHYVYRGKDLGFQMESDEFDHNEIQKMCFEIPDFKEKLEEMREKILATSKPGGEMEHNTDDEAEDDVNSYPKIAFLGTGSSEPNRIRGQSCIVVQLSKHSAIILDCGEDSFGQLHRFYGLKKARRILRKVKAIFVSHMHADHHLGLFSLLKERREAFDEKNIPFIPTFLMAPIQMRRWLIFYQRELEPVFHLFKFIKHQQDVKESDSDVPIELGSLEMMQEELGFTQYDAVEVEHCANSFGVTFTHKNGCKIVYSGDTRPCERLVDAGKDCDLLIHEATHEDALIGHAKAAKHSTFSEAMDVGKRMEAKHIILTHFSQRYAHMAPFFDMQLPSNVGIAFDNMMVCPRTLSQLPPMIPPLTSLFSDQLQKLEIKNIKRTREQAEQDFSADET